MEGTSTETGDEFCQSLVRHVAQTLGVSYAFVAEFAGARTRVRTVAFWAKDHIAPNIEYDLAGTPCEEVLQAGLCHYACGVREKFPQDRALIDLAIESYLGVPLVDDSGEVLGHLAVFDEQPMPREPKTAFILRLFANRAVAELSRLRMEGLLRESEQRYRDLFDEAPIAYVYEDTDTRFISANRAAMNLLGLKPEDMPGTVGMSLVAPNQANREPLQNAFADIRRGKERRLVELELRRKDDGRPIWVQFWSRPEPDGKHTRTMIIDITDRVLAEREKARLQQQNAYLQEEIKATLNFDEIVGLSPTLAATLAHVRAVGPTDTTVLVTGETGTGKELVARAIHSVSLRKDKPLIKLNCRGLAGGTRRERIVRPRKGRVHRRHLEATGAIRIGRRRHNLSRRDR